MTRATTLEAEKVERAFNKRTRGPRQIVGWMEERREFFCPVCQEGRSPEAAGWGRERN